MSRSLGHALGAFGAGLLFGIGLVVSGMTQPQKVIGFLDLFGQFDPSLMFVMLGAIAVHAVAYRFSVRRGRPLFAPAFEWPSRRNVDRKLLLGAAVFGAGWGLGGYCPGPAVVSLPGGGWQALSFVLAMLAGMWVTARVEALMAGRLRAEDSGSMPENAASQL
jgi:uncharacterized protein